MQKRPLASEMKFTPYQKFVVGILAFLQFTIILDFMIISPLGATLMPSLHITPSQFGLVVSVYAFAAGASGFLTAGFADRYDRKKLLLFFYSGFILGTLFCGLAPTYPFLLAARMVTGLFGGVLGSVVLAITTDLFPFQMRGRVMGMLQTAFAASQILGLPAGIFLSNHWGWHAAFFMIVTVATTVGIVIALKLKPIDEHLKLKPDHSAVHHLFTTMRNPRYIFAFVLTAFLSIGGFMLMPFSSAFIVNNVKIPIENLPIIYLITGLCSIFIGPLVGKLSDRVGKYRTFTFGTLVSITTVLVYTSLGPSSLPVVIVVNAVMFVGIFSRMIPAQALTSAIPSADSRGAFMSVSASIQQVSGGIASIAAGLIVMENADGTISHFNTLGYVMTGISLTSLVMMYYLSQMVMRIQAERSSQAKAIVSAEVVLSH
jgi:predicted MFS family arabinose efflux permease